MTTLTFDKIKKAVGKNIKYYDDTSGWKTGRDVTETDIGEFVNQLYREDLFPLFVAQNPQDFRREAYTDSWIASGTADAGLSGSTLVATTSIFTNDMVGLYVWNDTASEKSKIVAYTSSTTVTLEDSDISDWSSDSIYVLGQEFIFGGDATDIWTIETIGVRYNAADSSYKNAGILRFKPDVFQQGSEEGSQVSPIAYPTTKTVSGVPKTAVGILPKFENKVSNALYASYLEMPAEMSSSGDIPRLPVALVLIDGATAKAFRKKQDHKGANQWDAAYEKKKLEAVSRYTPMASAYPVEVMLPRRTSNIYRRDY